MLAQISMHKDILALQLFNKEYFFFKKKKNQLVIIYKQTTKLHINTQLCLNGGQSL